MVFFNSLYGIRLDLELGTDDSTVLFTTDRRKAAINAGHEEFGRETKCLLRRSTFALTGGTAEVDLNAISSSDFMELAQEPVEFWYTDASSNVTVLSGDDLPKRDVQWLHRYEPGWQVSTVASSEAQLPQVYYERIEGGNRYLGFWPTPSTGSSASIEVKVPYVARCVSMSSDAEEPFTANSSVRKELRVYHQALVHYAAYQLEKLRRDDQASDRQFQRFMSYVAMYLRDKRSKGGAAVTFVRNYFSRGGRVADRGADPRT